jgi:hypothetical protein
MQVITIMPGHSQTYRTGIIFKTPMTALATAQYKTGPIQIPNSFPDLPWHDFNY